MQQIPYDETNLGPWCKKSPRLLILNPNHFSYHFSRMPKFSLILSIFCAYPTSNSTSIDAPSQHQPIDVLKKEEIGVPTYCKHSGSGIGKEERLR